MSPKTRKIHEVKQSLYESSVKKINYLLERSLFQTSTELKISPSRIEINKISDIQQVMAIKIEGNELDIGC